MAFNRLPSADGRSPACFEEQARYVGIDNTFTRFNDTATYCIETDGGAGPTIEFAQTPEGGWTDQFVNQWVPNLTQAATDAGVKWILEAAFVSPSNPADISGGNSGLPGVLTPAIAQQFVDNAMSWRFLQITVCPGSPTPTRFFRKASDIYGDEERNLLITPTQLGPFREFRVCEECTKDGIETDWYVRNDAPEADPNRLEPFSWDKITDSGQIPKCAVPCGTIAVAPSPTSPTCQFELVPGCDNGNPIPNTNPQEFTRINGIYEYCDGAVGPFFTQDVQQPDGTFVAEDYVLQGVFVDCDTGEPIITPPPECDDFVITDLFSVENKTPGIKNREWANLGPANPFGSDPKPVEEYLESFDFSVAPTTDTVVTANTFALNDTDNTANVLDYQRRDGWICVQEPIEIEFGTNSEGYIGFWLGECGGEQQRLISYAKPVGLERTPRVVIPRGIHSVRLDNVDWGGSNSNWTVYRVEGGVAVADNDLMDALVSTTQPYEVCKKVKVCKPSGVILGLLSGAVIEPADCYDCSLKCEADGLAGLCDCITDALMIDKPDTENYTVEFKSSGLTSVLTDKGEAITNGPHDFTDLNAGQNASNNADIAAAQNDIQAFLDANGGGTVTLEYLSQSILTITVTGTSCAMLSADDDSNPGPHDFEVA